MWCIWVNLCNAAKCETYLDWYFLMEQLEVDVLITALWLNEKESTTKSHALRSLHTDLVASLEFCGTSSGILTGTCHPCQSTPESLCKYPHTSCRVRMLYVGAWPEVSAFQLLTVISSLQTFISHLPERHLTTFYQELKSSWGTIHRAISMEQWMCHQLFLFCCHSRCEVMWDCLT